MKQITKLLSHRVVMVGLLLLIQFGAILALVLKFNEYYVYFYTLCDLIALIITVYIVSLKSNPGYKIAWIVTIMAIPLFGVLLYLIFGGNRLSNREKKKMLEIYQHTKDYFVQDIETERHLSEASKAAYAQSKYIRDYALCPVHEHTKTTYFPRGEDFYKDFLTELKAAKQFIFIEFFIIAEGTMWNTTLDILEQKAKEGVDVRLLYDDMGCIFTLPKDYDQQLRKRGIKCTAFNPFIPILTSRFNNRDH
jgi:cardiolipin synthase